MLYNTFQARVGRHQDLIKEKLINNMILRTGHPTDVIRIRTERDPRTQDILSNKIVAADVVSVIMPPLIDIPMRRLTRDTAGSPEILSLSPTELFPFELFSPTTSDIRRDDILFRILKNDTDEPYVMALVIKDELVTFSYASVLYIKYNAAYYEQQVPATIAQKIVEIANRRELLEW